jgi:hypothetical protein
MSLLEKRKFDGEAFGDVPSQQGGSTCSLLDGEAEYAAGEGNIRSRRTDDARLMQSAGVSRADGVAGVLEWDGYARSLCMVQHAREEGEALSWDGRGILGQTYGKATEKAQPIGSSQSLGIRQSLIQSLAQQPILTLSEPIASGRVSHTLTLNHHSTAEIYLPH